MPTQNNPQNQSNYVNTKKEDDKNDTKMEDASGQNELNNISQYQAMQEAMDLDEIIARSICTVDNTETRKRLAA